MQNERKSNDGKQERLRLVHQGTPIDPPVIQDTLTDPMIDPDLVTVIGAWDGLPEALRAGIVAMVRSASGGSL